MLQGTAIRVAIRLVGFAGRLVRLRLPARCRRARRATGLVAATLQTRSRRRSTLRVVSVGCRQQTDRVCSISFYGKIQCRPGQEFCALPL